jgi:hypothetical protein
LSTQGGSDGSANAAEEAGFATAGERASDVWRDKIAFANVDLDKGKVPANLGTVLNDDIVFKKVK